MSKTVPFPLPVAGVDMLSNETSLLKGTVRRAENVDIGRSGAVSRRTGATVLMAGSGFHSMWTSKRGLTFLAQNSTLYTFTPDGLTALTTLNSSARLSYTEYNGDVYWVSKTDIGWLPANDTVARVPVPNLDPVPALSVGYGGLTKGKYGVSVCFIDERREEGGATPMQIVDLPNGGGIKLSNLPQHAGWGLRIYITDPDGERVHLAEEVPAVFSSYVITQVADGGDCNTLYLRPMPTGEFVAWMAGRLYVASKNTLYFSDPFRPRQCDIAHNFVSFSGQIRFIEAVSDGLYVADDRGVWFLGGQDPSQFKLTPVSFHRVVARSAVKMQPSDLPQDKVQTGNPVVVWLSTAGYVVGMDSGVTVELQADKVRVPDWLSGRSTVLLRKGLKQLVTTVNSASTVASGTAVDSTIS